MTGSEFRETHGNPATWTDREFEQFADCATPGDPQPAREALARLKARKQATTDYQPAA